MTTERRRLYQLAYPTGVKRPVYLEDSGNTLMITGIVIEGMGLSNTLLAPWSTVQDAPPAVPLTLVEWQEFLRISDDPKVFEVDPTGYVKAVHRKSERAASGVVQQQVWARDGFQCFTPDTLITMANGSQKPIQSVSVGDFVYDVFGVPQQVEYVHKEFVSRELVGLRHRGNGDWLWTTPEHRIITTDWDGTLNINGIPASEISTNTYIAECHPFTCGDRSIVDLIDFYDNLRYIRFKDEKVKNYCGPWVNRFIPADEQLGRLVGYYLSEGWVMKPDTGKVVAFGFHAKEKIFHSDLGCLVKELFGVNSSIRIEDNQAVVYVCNKLVASFLMRLCGVGCGHKHILPNDFRLPFQHGVLSGAMRGDGHFDENLSKAVLTLGNEQLCRELYTLAITLGINPTLSKTQYRINRKPTKTVVFNGFEYNKVIELCDLPLRIYTPKRPKYSDRNRNGIHTISKITEIQHSLYNGFVYDLQVSGSHTYIANFVAVHNCIYCARKMGEVLLTIDHFVPLERGGSDHPDNLISACGRCNKLKGDRDPEEFCATEGYDYFGLQKYLAGRASRVFLAHLR